MARDGSLLLRILPWVFCALLLGLFLRTLAQERQDPDGAPPSAATSAAPRAAPTPAARPTTPRSPANVAPRPRLTATPADVLPRPRDPEGRYAAARVATRLHATLDVARARAAALARDLDHARAEVEQARREVAEARAAATPVPSTPDTEAATPAPAASSTPSGAPRPEPAANPPEAAPRATPSTPSTPGAATPGAATRWIQALETLDADASAAAMRTLLEETLPGGAEGLAAAAATRPAVVPAWVGALLRAEASPARARELVALLRQVAPDALPATVPVASWTLRPFADAGVLETVLLEDSDTARRVLARVAARPLGEGDDAPLRAALTRALSAPSLARVTLAARIIGQHALVVGAGLEAPLHAAWTSMQKLSPETRARAAAHVLHAAARIDLANDPEARSRWRRAALEGLAAHDGRQRVAATLLAESLLDRRIAFDPHASAAARAKALRTLETSWPAK